MVMVTVMVTVTTVKINKAVCLIQFYEDLIRKTLNIIIVIL